MVVAIARGEGLPTAEHVETNFDRLRGHLKADSLATKLVAAYAAAAPAAPANAVSAVLTARLTEIVRSHAESQDKTD